MSVEQFNRILYDLYSMDTRMPPLFGKWTEEFKRASYSQWAVDELKYFVKSRIYPRDGGTVEEFRKAVQDFATKMKQYSAVNPQTELIFMEGERMAVNVLDVLSAMM